MHLTLDVWLSIRAQPPIPPQLRRTALSPLLLALRRARPRIECPVLLTHPSWSSFLPRARRSFSHHDRDPNHRPTLPSSPAYSHIIHVRCRCDHQQSLQCSKRCLQQFRQATEDEHIWQRRYRRTAKAREPQRRSPEVTTITPLIFRPPLPAPQSFSASSFFPVQLCARLCSRCPLPAARCPLPAGHRNHDAG